MAMATRDLERGCEQLVEKLSIREAREMVVCRQILFPLPRLLQLLVGLFQFPRIPLGLGLGPLEIGMTLL